MNHEMHEIRLAFIRAFRGTQLFIRLNFSFMGCRIVGRTQWKRNALIIFAAVKSEDGCRIPNPPSSRSTNNTNSWTWPH